ncbi:MAG: OmpP1/FadL family transporter [Pseudomonadota bacterium]
MKYNSLTLLISAALVTLSATAHASGYRFGSQSVAAQSTADANGAEAADASTIFSNPAGLSRLEGTQISAGATVVVPHSSYTDTGSTRFTGTPAGGTAAHGYAPDSVTAPSLYLSSKINAQWSAGVGLFVPYGAKLDYGDTWTGRYALSNIKLEAVTLNPSVAFKLNEKHSFGFGVSAEYMKASLAQAVDVPGSVAALSANPAVAAALLKQIVALGGNPAALAAVKDGHGANDGHDWGYGFNLGYMFQLDPATRFGLAYRSSISHQLEGSTVWDFSHSTTDAVVNQVLAANSHRANSAALVALRTPETLSANVFHQIDAKWDAMADLTWTRHSRMGDLHIQFPGTTEGDEVIRQQWKNTYRLSVGGAYHYNDALTLRSGISYDQSPVRSAELTHPALPDADRYQFSFGANYKLSPHSSIDLAYSYIDFKNASLNYKNNCTPLTVGCTGNGETTRGVVKTQVQLLGIAYNYLF